MGENAWAAFARDVERRLMGGLPSDVAKIVADMRTGLTDILLHRGDEKKELELLHWRGDYRNTDRRGNGG